MTLLQSVTRVVPFNVLCVRVSLLDQVLSGLPPGRTYRLRLRATGSAGDVAVAAADITVRAARPFAGTFTVAMEVSFC